MAQPIHQIDTHFDIDEDHVEEDIEMVKQKHNRSFRTATAVAILIAAASLIYIFSTIRLVRDGLYFRQ